MFNIFGVVTYPKLCPRQPIFNLRRDDLTLSQTYLLLEWTTFQKTCKLPPEFQINFHNLAASGKQDVLHNDKCDVPPWLVPLKYISVKCVVNTIYVKKPSKGGLKRYQIDIYKWLLKNIQRRRNRVSDLNFKLETAVLLIHSFHSNGGTLQNFRILSYYVLQMLSERYCVLGVLWLVYLLHYFYLKLSTQNIN